MTVQQLHGLLTVTQVAEKAQCSAQLVYAEIQRGHLNASRIGRCLRVTYTEFNRWVEERRVA